MQIQQLIHQLSHSISSHLPPSSNTPNQPTMKLVPLSLALTLLSTTSAQTWQVKFWGSLDCSPSGVPISQRTGTGSEGCRQISGRNGYPSSYTFNSAGAFHAMICFDSACNDCIEVGGDPETNIDCVTDGTECGQAMNPFRSFLVTRNENCQG